MTRPSQPVSSISVLLIRKLQHTARCASPTLARDRYLVGAFSVIVKLCEGSFTALSSSAHLWTWVWLTPKMLSQRMLMPMVMPHTVCRSRGSAARLSRLGPTRPSP